MQLVATLATFNDGPPADANDPRVALLRQTLRGTRLEAHRF